MITESNFHEPDEQPVSERQPSKAKGIALVALIALLLAGNIYLLSRVSGLQTQMSDLQAKFSSDVQGLQTASSASAGEAARQVEELRVVLEEARKEAASKAQSEARRQSDRVAQTMTEHQRKQQEALLGQLGDVRTSAESANQGVEVVRGDVANVRTEIDGQKSALEQTGSALQETRGNVDRLNGVVSENGTAIERLRKYNERERIEFNLTKSDEMQRVGDVQVKLRKTDAKRNRYTIEILADDKLVVQKDRHVAEPVEFYVGSGPLPYELVVTSVNKNNITGFLAKPKVEMARR
jgi:hypothetical protein